MSTTDEQFKEFEHHVQEWADALGLHGWTIHATHSELLDLNTIAECRWNYTGRIANIILNKVTALEGEGLRETALHEVLHVLLNPLHHIAMADDIPEGTKEDLFASEAHSVIRALVKLIAPPRIPDFDFLLSRENNA